MASPAVIIRLQNLPLEARSVDIRKFFDKLLIPDGGVHIIGGENGDAFIAFQSDEDARIAMSRNGYYLCNAQVKLFLSSKHEMQTVIAAARNQHMQATTAATPPQMIHQQVSQAKIVQPQMLNPSQNAYEVHQKPPQTNLSTSNNLLSSLNKFIATNNNNNNSSSTNNSNSYQNNHVVHSSSLGNMNSNNTTKNIGGVYNTDKSSEKFVFDQIKMTNHSGKKPLISAPPPSFQLSTSTSSLSSVNLPIDTSIKPPSINMQVETPVKTPQVPKLSLNTDALGPLLNDILLKTNKTPIQSVSTNTATSNSNNQNISIDQILSLLQAHKNTEVTSENKDFQKTQQEQYNANNNNSTNDNNINYNRNISQNYSNSNSFESNNENNKFPNNSHPFNNNNNSPSHDNDNNFDSNNSNSSTYLSKTYSNFKPTFKRKNEDLGPNNSNNSSNFNNNRSNASSESERQIKYQRTGPPFNANSTNNSLDPIIKVKNFNTNCSYKDIRTFLQGIQIDHDGIKLLSDSNGNKSGSAFVKLMTITDLKKALCRNGQFYEENIISVSQSNEAEFSKGVVLSPTHGFSSNTTSTNNNKQFSSSNIGTQNNRYKNNNSNNTSSISNNFNNENNFKREQNLKQTENEGFYLKIYGLPVGFEENELKNMFNNVNFISIFTSQPMPVTSTTLNNEQTTVLKAKKICVVETQLDLEKALTRQNERVGKSKLQIFQMNKNEFDREISFINGNHKSQNNNNSNYQNNNKNYKNNNQNSIDEDQINLDEPHYPISDDLYIYMSGVPFSVKEIDVRTYFQSINVVEAVIIHDLQTIKPTGECICQLMTKKDRDLALEKDDQLFRNRVIKIKSLTYVEYQQYISLQGKIKQQLANKQKKNNAILPTPLLPLAAPLMANINDDQSFSQQQNKRIVSFNQNSQNFSNYQNNSNNNNNNRFQNNEKRTNFNNNNKYNGSNNSHSSIQNKQYSNQNQNNKTNTPSLIDLPPLPPELQKYRNSLVLLSNVSFDASREDILDLLKNFSPVEQTLKIRHDEMGQPTGDAIVACQNSDDAIRACTELNNIHFMGLEIKTALVSS